MGKPAAKKNDQIIGTDIHIVMIPSPGGPVPTPLPHPFTGILDSELSEDVNIEGQPAALVGSKATNTPAHIPQGGPFQTPPKDEGTVQIGSNTVKINGKGVARAGDSAMTCHDPADQMTGTVMAVSTVMVGD